MRIHDNAGEGQPRAHLPPVHRGHGADVRRSAAELRNAPQQENMVAHLRAHHLRPCFKPACAADMDYRHARPPQMVPLLRGVRHQPAVSLLPCRRAERVVGSGESALGRGRNGRHQHKGLDLQCCVCALRRRQRDVGFASVCRGLCASQLVRGSGTI